MNPRLRLDGSTPTEDTLRVVDRAHAALPTDAVARLTDAGRKLSIKD